MYQCILNVLLWNDWSKVTYSQVHGSPVLKTFVLQSFYWISATRFAKLIQFWQDPKGRKNCGKKLVFHWRKISYFVFMYIFPLLLLLILSFQIYIHIFISFQWFTVRWVEPKYVALLRYLIYFFIIFIYLFIYYLCIYIYIYIYVCVCVCVYECVCVCVCVCVRVFTYTYISPIPRWRHIG